MEPSILGACTGCVKSYDGLVIRIGSIVLRVDDLQRQAAFWEAALRYERVDMDHDFVLLRPKDGVGPNVSLDRVCSSLAGEVQRLLVLGATEIHWDKRPPDADYVIPADLEGNRFCVVDTARWLSPRLPSSRAPGQACRT